MSIYRELTNDYLKQAAIDVLQVPSELNWMKEKLLVAQVKILAEIGSAAFGTLSHFFTIPTIKKLISVDLPNGCFGGSDKNFHLLCENSASEQAKDFGIEFNAIVGDSHNDNTFLELEKVLEGNLIDAVLIDGDHYWNPEINNGINGVAEDFFRICNFMKENGLIFFHDIRDSSYHHNQGCLVDYFWNRMKTYFSFEEYIAPLEESILKNSQSAPDGWAGIGLIHFDSQKFKIFKEEFKKQEKTVSIVIPVFNNCELTKKCLNSILSSEQYNSSSKIIEIFVHSNGSTDNTQNMLEEFQKRDARIIPIFSDHAIGFSRAVNFCLPYTNGNYICILNNDVELGSNWLDLLLNGFNDTTVGCSGVNWSNVKGYEKFILGYCRVFKRTVLEKIACLNESLNYHEDDEISNRVKQNYKLYAHCNPSTEEGWQTHVNFPISHFGSASYQSLSNITEIQKHDREKFYFYLKYHNKNYVLIADNNHEFLSKTITNLVKEDANCLICIVAPKQETLNDLFYNTTQEEKDLFYGNNTHIIPALLTENKIDKLKEVGRNFFGKDKNIFYITDRNYKDGIDLTYLCSWTNCESMGILSKEYVKNLPTNINCALKNVLGESNETDGLIKYKLNRSEIEDKHELGILFSYPDSYGLLDGYKKRILFSGPDTTGGINGFAENTNKVDYLICPSNLARQYAINLGVKVPIFVVPHGVNTEIFQYVDRKESFKNKDIFKFLYIGECSDRKGSFQLIEAFKKAFGNDIKNVHLGMFGNNKMEFYGKEQLIKLIDNDDRIQLSLQHRTQNEIANIMHESHVYVCPSRADTFNMPILEAMSTGLIVIANDQLGVSEFIEGRYLKIKNKRVPVKNHPWFKDGTWLESDVEHLSELMKEVFKNYEKYLE